MKTVSVVITTHMRPPEIVARALNSVLAQTYENIEIILVDDSPENYSERDAIRELALQKGVHYIPHTRCQGACAARNTGLAKAKGEFVAFLDDDDVWIDTKIERQVNAFAEETCLVYCGSETVYEETGVVRDNKITVKTGMVYDSLIYDNFIGSTSFPLLRRSCLEAVGGFDPLMQSAQDYDVWLRLAEKYPIDCVPACLVRYYVHSGERISSNYSKKIAGLERINQKNIDYLTTHKKAYAIRLFKLVPYYAKNGQKSKALKTWWLAFKQVPCHIKTAAVYFGKILRANP